jgi:hypothetical protein
MATRRVVTGVDEAGRSVIVSDGLAEQLVIDSGRSLQLDDVWGADARQVVPTDGAKPSYHRFFPPPLGFRVMILHVDPESSDGAPFDYDAYVEERERVLIGYSEDAAVDQERPTLHSTHTVDVALVVDGEVILGLDDGAAVTLRRGDVVVQNGTRHSWHNRSTARCSIAVFLVGADTAG